MTDLAEVVGVYTPPVTPKQQLASSIVGAAFMSLMTVLPVIMAGGAA